jgi:hypothetical protein
VRGHLLEGMQIATIRHTEMAEQFIVPLAAVSSVMECVLGSSPTKAFQLDVVDELAVKFRKEEERCSCLKKSDVRVCD